MIKLKLHPGPYWLDLGFGVEVQVEPLSAIILTIARAAPEVAELPDDTANDLRFAHVTNVVAGLVISGWRGVGDEAGEPLPVSPEAVAALMSVPQLHRAFAQGYVAPAFLLASEKNG